MRIFCVGRNYVEHIQELNNEKPDDPVIFTKPDTALIRNNGPFYLPEFSKDIHHEVELVLRICKEGKHIAEEFAGKYFDQVTVGLDFTARDIQQRQKEKGLPWEPAKAFDGSAPVGDFIPVEKIKDRIDIAFSLKRNGTIVQEGASSHMIFSFEKIIAYVSKYVTIRKGDFIFTGTPKGVGRIEVGDKLEAFLEGDRLLSVNVR